MKGQWAIVGSVLAVLLLALAAGLAQAQGPQPAGGAGPQAALGTAFTYQGQLKQDGSPVNGNCDFLFTLWDTETGGNQIGPDQQKSNVPVTNGYFTVELDFGDSAFQGDARWLEIAVRCPAGSGSYTTLAPRQALTAAPYALSLRPGAQVVGSVTADPYAVIYARNADTSGYTYGVWGVSRSTAGAGVYGWASASSGTTYGVWGESASTSGCGVYGYAIATSGDARGVFGQSDSTAGRGVYGLANATSGTTYGVYGRSESTAGAGVYGWASATSGVTYGVWGQSDSTGGHGVVGEALATSGTTYGVWGESRSTNGRGVVGEASAPSGTTYGVYGRSWSPDGYGGYFLNSSFNGVALYAGGGSGHGVYATSEGPAMNGAALYAKAYNGGGIAIWGSNASTDSTLVLENLGTGDLLKAFISGGELRFRFQNDGWARADGGWTTPAADMAELLPAAPGLEPGDVLVVGADGKLARSTQAYQPTVVGVYSTRPGFVGGQPVEGEPEGHIPLAVVGVVPVKASAENGPIRPGDLLVASATPGHAMRADRFVGGAIIGKALEGLEKGTGVIQMLVVLQ